MLRRIALGALAATVISLQALTGGAATAAPPGEPTLLAPADGGIATEATPTLRVAVADPDGTAPEVRFEGRRKGAMTGGPGAGEPFTVVALSDIQNYTSASRAATIAAQSQWVVDTRSTLNTQFVVQLGDLVSSLSWAGHWPYASNGLKILNDHGVPHAVIAGNHDFNTTTGAHTEYDTWFPPSRFASAQWTPASATYGGYMGQDQFGDDPVDRANMNNYSLFSAGGVDWLVLGLEWEAPAASLEWADRVLDAFPDRQVIMFTHAFLTEGGTRRTAAQRPGGTPPETIWQTFVRNHCQVRLILNGHESGSTQSESRRTDQNDCGADVHQILSNYQTRPNGGDGWLRTYTFDPVAGTMTAKTFSPTLQAFETDANSAFTLPFPLATPVPAPLEPIGTATAQAGEAQIDWAGLEPDVEYEWRAVASDGTTDVASDVWTFRTPAPAQDPGVQDDFSRTVATGWGSADPAHGWTTSSASSFSVGGGAGRITVAPSAQRIATVNDFSLADGSASMTFAATPTPTGSGTYVSLVTRYSGPVDYRAKMSLRASGTAGLSIVRRSGSTETTLATATVPGGFTAGSTVSIRMEVEGDAPVALRAKTWVGAQEPATWLVTATDTSPARAVTGTVGVAGYVSGTSAAPASILVDRIQATPLGTTPPDPVNIAPTAHIQVVSQSGRSVSVSGAGSTDPDGSVVGWNWSFGDGATATGPTATHEYLADGTYTLTLVVTDEDAATGQTTAPVSVQGTAEPEPEPEPDELAADSFTRTATGGWGTADRGGAWSAVTSAGSQSVQSGAGRHSLATPGTSAASALATAIAGTRIEVRVDVSFSRSGSGGTMWAGVSPRSVTDTTDYRLKINVGSSGRPRLDLVRRVGSAETVIASTSLSSVTVTADTRYSVVVQLSAEAGTTTLRAKLHPAGQPEPSAWAVTGSDATSALQNPGRILTWSYLSGSATAPVTVSYDDLVVTSF